MEREYAYFAGYLIYTGLFTGKGKFLSCGKAHVVRSQELVDLSSL